MTIVTVSYPAGEAFDLDYYLGTHMPLVQERWGSLGLSEWRVLKGVPGPDGAPPPTQITAILTFASLEAFAAAAKAHGKEIFADIPNFTQATAAVQLHEYAK
jgi:uncharacterized protein (TIGR02118 family)